MANLTEVSQWENVIRQLENGEAATGGADGLANIQAKQLANRTQYLKNNYLPLAGGIMTGYGVSKSDDTSSLSLLGGTARLKGASFVAMGNKSTYNAGEFWVETGKIDSNSCTLVGNPFGELIWTKNKVKTDLAGSAILAKSLGTNGYVKYANNLIIQWGSSGSINDSSEGLEITFPIQFSTEVFSLVANGSTGGAAKFHITTKHVTTTSAYLVANGSIPDGSNSFCKWLAIGW